MHDRLPQIASLSTGPFNRRRLVSLSLPLFCLKDHSAKMEAEPDAYHEEFREGFLQLADEHDGFVVVDATGGIEAVHERVVEEVAAFFSSGDFSD